METGSKLRMLQLTELEILTEFARICDMHGLRYYLVGGTLLGAVRHGGFIPWDDDIDVAMPREDYDRFAQLAPRELAEEYFYQCPDTDPNYYLSYAKIRQNGTEVYEERFKNSRFHKGVFVDIFPLDFCPKRGWLCHLLFNTLAVMNYRGQIDSGEIYKPYSEWSGKVGYGVLKLLSPPKLIKTRRYLLKLSKSLSRGDYVASYSGAYGYYKEVFPWEWFNSPELGLFEGKMYSYPSKSKNLLQQLYGSNYMNPPALSEQQTHVDIDHTVF